MSGQTFGKLTVKCYAGQSKAGKARWLCICACGKEKIAVGQRLRNGHIKSCGCARWDGTCNLKHGFARKDENGKVSREYSLWCNARARSLREKLPFDIKVEEITIPSHCPVLGIPLLNGKGRPTDNSPTIDKIIPELGYIKGNWAVVSYRANRIKNDATPEELRKLAEFFAPYAKAQGAR